MTSNKEPQRTLAIAVILFIVGAISYAAFPDKSPQEPVRKMYKSATGNVLFTHKTHNAMSTSGYGLACEDCHHHNEDDPAEYKACGTCHSSELTRSIPDSCLECHEPGETHHSEENRETYSCAECHTSPDNASMPTACGDCHDPDDVAGEEKLMNFQKRSDAFHTQCIGCHKEYGAGAPVECSSCHVM